MFTIAFTVVWPVAVLVGYEVWRRHVVKKALTALTEYYDKARDEADRIEQAAAGELHHIDEIAEGYIDASKAILKKAE